MLLHLFCLYCLVQCTKQSSSVCGKFLVLCLFYCICCIIEYFVFLFWGSFLILKMN
jgi:hypothetical protein